MVTRITWLVWYFCVHFFANELEIFDSELTYFCKYIGRRGLRYVKIEESTHPYFTTFYEATITIDTNYAYQKQFLAVDKFIHWQSHETTA